MTDHVKYHQDRATHEMALGLTAASIAAARAHLQLASLHRERVLALAGRLTTSKPPLVMT